MLKILGYFPSYNTRRVLFTAAMAQVPFEFQMVDIAKGEQKSPEFLSLSPLGKTPALITDKGNIYESHTMSRYIANSAEDRFFYPKDPFERAQVEQKCDEITFQIGQTLVELVYECFLNEAFGFGTKNMENVAALTEKANGFAKGINENLGSKAYLAGDQPTLADAVAYSFFETHETSGFKWDPFDKIVSWLHRMEARGEVKNIKETYQIWGTNQSNAA